jgi:hypothetical protein
MNQKDRSRNPPRGVLGADGLDVEMPLSLGEPKRALDGRSVEEPRGALGGDRAEVGKGGPASVRLRELCDSVVKFSLATSLAIARLDEGDQPLSPFASRVILSMNSFLPRV